MALVLAAKRPIQVIDEGGQARTAYVVRGLLLPP
jgi:hypothetical protein